MTTSGHTGPARDNEAKSAIGGRANPLGLLGMSEDILHYAVAVLLLAIAVMVVYNTVSALAKPGTTFSNRIIDGVDGVLFVIIIMELMATVVAHFLHAGFQLKPFLIIGIISAVRHILTIGARLTLSAELSADQFQRSQIELGVETGVVLGLSIGLLLVRIGDRTGTNILEGD